MLEQYPPLQESLEALPEEIKDREVDMLDFEHFFNKPTAKSKTNNFGGLIYIVSKDIKGLPKLYCFTVFAN
jgi:hypothetical protein